jgi:hypothetical protein
MNKVVHTWVVCERYMYADGTFAAWVVLESVAPAEQRSHLESFERPANGELVSERRVFRASVEVNDP